MSTPTAPRRVVLLGATGSIGSQACDVIARYPERFTLVGAVVGRDVAGLADVVRRFKVARCAVTSPPVGATLPEGCGVGPEAVNELAAMDADIVCVGIPGAAALSPTLAALDAGRDLALATKEVLVIVGDLVAERLRAHGSQLFPVDSEHSALWQCLRGEDRGAVRRLILTASGGPFRNRPLDTMATVTPEEALQHPNWEMGPKVTVDSATMMNKGLEIIEAHHLFEIAYENIDVMIHPTSIIHSMVEFCDGATMLQAGIPDMRVPIALALSGGERLPGVVPPADLAAESPLELFAVDSLRFPAVELARGAGERGGVAPAALNAANEVAVAAFLEGRLRFDAIVATVARVLDDVPVPVSLNLDTVLAADAWAREATAGAITSAAARP